MCRPVAGLGQETGGLTLAAVLRAGQPDVAAIWTATLPSPDRRDRRVAYLGAEARGPLSSPLYCQRRRVGLKRVGLGEFRPALSISHPGAEQGFWRQVSGRPPSTVCAG